MHCYGNDMNALPDTEQNLLANLIRSTGREPGGFHVTLEADGFVRVVGPRGTACYPRENWITRFSRHLDRAFFDGGMPRAETGAERPTSRRRAVACAAAPARATQE